MANNSLNKDDDITYPLLTPMQFIAKSEDLRESGVYWCQEKWDVFLTLDLRSKGWSISCKFSARPNKEELFCSKCHYQLKWRITVIVK